MMNVLAAKISKISNGEITLKIYNGAVKLITITETDTINAGEPTEKKAAGENKNPHCISLDIPDNHIELFEKLWNLYPKKRGRGRISDAKIKALLMKYGFEQIKRAVERYLSERKDTDIQFIANGSTFFNSGYIDYLDNKYEKLPSCVNSESPIHNNNASGDIERRKLEMGLTGE